MTEEEIQALQAAKDEAERNLQAAKAEAEKAKADLGGVVNELIGERQKKQKALDDAMAAAGKGTPEGGDINKQPNADPGDVEKIVQAELERRDAERRKEDFQSAFDEFTKSKTEFSGDSSGLVLEKFKNGMNRFNFSDLKTKEEVKQRLEEVYRFMNQKPSEEGGTDYEGTPRVPGAPSAGDTRLPSDVESTLKSTGLSEENYKNLSSKYPDALAGLGIGT